jgi:hypothetical protein
MGILLLCLPCEEIMRIHENAQLRRLARDVCRQGVRDFLLGDPANPKRKIISQLAAYQFLVSQDFQFWADAADRDFDVNRLLKNATQARETYQKFMTGETK